MTDIVERLRAGHDSIDLHGEAADEIERLRASNADLKASNATLDRSNMELRVEIKLLRERNNGLEIAHQQMAKTLDNAYAEIAELRAAIEPLRAASDLDLPVPQRPLASP